MIKLKTIGWEAIEPISENTLQIFITNQCNKRCRGCFYGKRLDNREMSFERYCSIINKFKTNTKKVILIGGEPSLHPSVTDMVRYNQDCGLKTTIYTNGRDLGIFKDVVNDTVKVRVGVMGNRVSEKPLCEVDDDVLYPITVVYMLRQDNLHELYSTAQQAEYRFNCTDFYISNIRELNRTGNFWFETTETLPLSPALQPNYTNIIQDFINQYEGRIQRLHICRRGIVEGVGIGVSTCRYINVFPNEEVTLCPFDISMGIVDGTVKDFDQDTYRSRRCQKNNQCILQKIVLKRECI